MKIDFLHLFYQFDGSQNEATLLSVSTSSKLIANKIFLNKEMIVRILYENKIKFDQYLI